MKLKQYFFIPILAGALFGDNVYSEEKEHLVVVGSRSVPRVVTDSSVPIDIISRSQIERTGITETAKILETLIPSFNFSVSTISDGTDSVRPATLRGLYPDQVLVLVNGKRRHNSALVHVNGSVGRGSAGTDFNAIPPSAIERIEVLRDGAAAQYGSDAIAGIINIILRSDVEFTEVGAYYGSTYQGDGEQRQYHLNTGLNVRETGFLHITAENRGRNHTNRAGDDLRDQYPLVGGNPDPREATFDRNNHRFGDAESDNDYFFFNSQTPLNDSVDFYAFGGISQRNTDGAGFYRRASDDRNNPSIYPDGFLPRIVTDIKDQSLSLGIQGTHNDWDWDISFTHGENQFEFNVENSLNVSLGNNSPTSADAGELIFTQNTFNLDLKRPWDLGLYQPLNVAFGVEYREDAYEIKAGEPASYIDGRALNQSGGPGIPGIQVFPGFRPDNEVDESRDNRAFYLDLETSLSPRWQLGVAARYENYSDFGTNLSGKITTRYEWSEKIAFRGTASTGFRAPSPMQQYFNNTSTQFVGAQSLPAEVVTARNDSAVVQQLGIDELKEETSFNFSLGAVLQPTETLSLSADIYYIEIDDRILLSSQYARVDAGKPGHSAALNAVLDPLGINRIQFFTNAVDTRNRGIDLSLSWQHQFENSGYLKLDALANFNSVEITNREKTPDILAETGTRLIDLRETTWLEDGQAAQNYSITTYYNYARHGITWRVKRYGSVSSSESDDPADKQEFGARWITDLEYSNQITSNISWTVGANNLLDTRPERNMDSTSFGGIFPYNRRVSPFGFNGGFYFTHLRFSF